MHYSFIKKFFFILLYISNVLLITGLFAPNATAKILPKNITQGTASWYGGIFEGRLTANGEVFQGNKFSAAHKKLRLGTVVLVENLSNGKQVLVRVNDRGPYVKQRIMDFSTRAARNLDMIEKGVTRIAFAIVSDAKSRPLNPAYAFFVRLIETDSFISMQSSLSAIATTLSRPVYTLFSPPPHNLFNICVGPFSTFVEAQNAAIKIEPYYPVVDIVLAPKKGGVLPSISLLDNTNKSTEQRK